MVLHLSQPSLDQLALEPFGIAPGGKQLLARLPPALDDVGQEQPRRGTQRRQIEHWMGRACAAQLLEQSGTSATTVGVNSDRSPRWPKGFVGSITHSRTLVAVALANSSHMRSVGIDAEPIVAPPELNAIERLCLTPSERMAVCELRDFVRAEAVTAIFSAKEALYKCLYPLVQRYFDFSCAQIDLANLNDGIVRARLLQTLSPEFYAGYMITGSHRGQLGHAFTAFCLT